MQKKLLFLQFVTDAMFETSHADVWQILECKRSSAEEAVPIAAHSELLSRADYRRPANSVQIWQQSCHCDVVARAWLLAARAKNAVELPVVVVVYYKDESECNAQTDAHAQRPRHQDNIQAHHQTHRLRKSMGKESAHGESRRDLSKGAAASKGAIG